MIASQRNVGTRSNYDKRSRHFYQEWVIAKRGASLRLPQTTG